MTYTSVFIISFKTSVRIYLTVKGQIGGDRYRHTLLFMGLLPKLL